MFSFLFIHINSILAHLDSSNVSQIIHNPEGIPVFLKLWANWCPHCKSFAPTWDQLANDTKYVDKVYIADIECESNRHTCQKYSQDPSYPQLYWIEPKDNTTIAYSGERSLSHFDFFIKKQLNFPLIPASTEEIPSYIETSNVSSVFFFTIATNDAKTLEIVKNLTSSFRSYESRFIWIDGADSSEPSLVAYTKPARKEEFTGNWNFEELSRFIQLRSLPFLIEIDSYVMKHLMRHHLLSFIHVQNDTRPLNKESIEICDTVSSIFITTCTNCMVAPWFCRYTDIDVNVSTDAYVIYDRHDKLYWTYNGTLTAESLKEWAKKVLNNEIIPKGPGVGPFSVILNIFYNKKAENQSYIPLFVGPFAVLLIIAVFAYDCINEHDPKPNQPVTKTKSE